MAVNPNPEALQRHMPAGVKFGSVEKLAKIFRNLYRTFSDLEGENIVLFARNANKYMRQSLIPSLEMGMVIITCLKGEPYLRARRWIDTMDRDPKRVHADHWCQQPQQLATPFLPFLPQQDAQPAIAQRDTGIGPDGQPDPNEPGHPGQAQQLFRPMRPAVAAVREQPLVDKNHCLKAYLL